MEKLTKEFGKHYLVEFIGCDRELLKFIKDVEEPFLEAVAKSQTKILKHFFHQFEPFGVTGIALISWSHISVHTWPEEGYMALDIFTCGEMFPEKTIEALKAHFGAEEVKQKVITRGF